MVKIFKKFFVGLIAFTLVFSLIGCGKSSSANNGKKVLTVGVESIYVPYINKIKTEFEKQNNVTIKVKTVSSMFDTMNSLHLDGPAGKAPDVMMSPFDLMAAAGTEGHLQQFGKSNLNNVSAKNKQLVTLGNNIYGIPDYVSSQVLFYNKDLISKAPKTFNDLEKLTKDKRFMLKSEPGKSTAFLCEWTAYYILSGAFRAYGGYMFGNGNTNPKDIGLNNSGSVKALTYATHWYKDIWPKGMQDSSSAWNFVRTEFINKKAAAIIADPLDVPSFKKANINYGVASIPQLPNGHKYVPFADGRAWVASSYAKNPQIAKKWVEYVTNSRNEYLQYKMVGVYPADTQALDKVSKSASDQLSKAIIDQQKIAEPLPIIPEASVVWANMTPAIYNAASGKYTPKAALDKAVNTIKTTIKQKFQK
ncbi:extracellular solute-binding protein [Sporolactobacillus vineae]|uniref:extracellular solute-binding protein n=1 Tax=Sporolactobacillus vineae TaxID=444463 RepID=UPI00028994F4|nr:extracellular solute-binding protein [Sporolactobacillus vineae]